MTNSDSPFQGDNPIPITIFSIGHSNQSVEDLLALLQQHAIQVVADVRSSPYSKYVSHFNSVPLAIAIKQTGIKYIFMGKELGGRPDGDEFYAADGRVLYNRVARSALFLDGIKRLQAGGRTYRVALLCSEEDPAICHRHLLIGRVLTEQGVNLCHIRADGHIQTEAEMRAQVEAEIRTQAEKPAYTQSLWGESLAEREEDTWRSIRPVSRKKQPLSSSES